MQKSLMLVACAALAHAHEFTPPRFVTTDLPSGKVGQPYTAEILLARMSKIPSSPEAYSESLPAGLSWGTRFQKGGYWGYPITGKPTQPGRYTVRVGAW